MEKFIAGLVPSITVVACVLLAVFISWLIAIPISRVEDKYDERVKKQK